ncbi:hypothetical protein FH508_0017250 [Lysinibacillus sp. CD3-6]|uniref:hypothetical protein n=1 Tax=Lysinibacillus sp. CD3-6 TaxID=2892541 RepID=UPI001D1799A4|nr:hypothetical protein [Lysinibacillus sp. CD3-6]UED82714.1 hypothetical protein FH508_0017250 [Lysinibacillus sp. CD3-6]
MLPSTKTSFIAFRQSTLSVNVITILGYADELVVVGAFINSGAPGKLFSSYTLSTWRYNEPSPYRRLSSHTAIHQQ